MVTTDMIKALIDSGEEICIKVSGTSMEPFLHDKKDSVFVKKTDSDPRIGDIYFFQDKFGRFIMHRLQKITKDGCCFRGDALDYCEGPIPPDKVFAKVIKIKHNGKVYHTNSAYFTFHKIVSPLKFTVKSYIYAKLAFCKDILN